MLTFESKLLLIIIFIITCLGLYFRYLDKLNRPIMKDNEIPIKDVEFQSRNFFEE